MRRFCINVCHICYAWIIFCLICLLLSGSHSTVAPYKKGVPLTNCEGFARTQNEDLLLVLEQEQGNELQRNAALAQVISKIEW